ncbi:MAG: hypothetical protein OEU51_10000 [Gammaproteobacteria bacterium]|jgi:hypothetical protein|nr:hypothetical protein [Gammaproteobacteria bacterium]
MNTDIGKLLEDMHSIQEQLEQFFDEARDRFRYTLEDGRVRFSREVQQLHRRYRVSSLRYLLDANLVNVLTAPVIYSMIIPLVFLDVCFTTYQHICFRAYGVSRVSRRDYLVNDRHKLAYLNTIEKINCNYCGYGNGVIAYAREIISRTEQYWCPIRHARRVPGAHERYPRFFAYGDAEAYLQGLEAKRQELGEETSENR